MSIINESDTNSKAISKEIQILKFYLINGEDFKNDENFGKFLKEILFDIPEIYKIEKLITKILNYIETEEELILIFNQKCSEQIKAIFKEVDISHVEKKAKIDNFFPKINKDISFKNIKEKIEGTLKNTSNKLSDVNTILDLNTVPFITNIQNTNTYITINSNDTESILSDMKNKTINLSNQKSTNFSDISVVSNKFNNELTNKTNYRGINSILADKIINLPKANKEINKKKKEKNSKNLLQKIFEKYDKNEIKQDNLQNKTNIIKQVVNKEFYQKDNKTPKIIENDKLKFSVRKNIPIADTSIADKYNHKIFKLNSLNMSQVKNKDISPTRTDLSEDEILVENTPTKLENFKFTKKSPNALNKMNFIKLFNQKKEN
jgi:hypothetical protein